MTRSTEKLIHAALRDGCREHCDALIDELRRLHAQRDALLEALKALLSDYDSAIDPGESKLIDKARAAIKAVEEEK